MESGTQKKPRVILIGGEKGGTGKTTIATHLAYMRATSGRPVILIDADPQRSASAFCASRTEAGRDPQIECVQLTAGKDETPAATLERIVDTILDLGKEFDDIIIDTGGRNSIELQVAVGIADAYYVPSDASQYDTWAFETTEALMARHGGGKAAYVIPNKIPTLPTHTRKQLRKLREAIEGSGYEHIRMLEGAHVCQRDYIRLTPEYGATVFEDVDEENRQHDDKACEEFFQLYLVIFNETREEWRARAREFMRSKGYEVDQGKSAAPDEETDTAPIDAAADQQRVRA